MITTGLSNNDALEKRHVWIKTQVRDPKATEFRHLDEEDPPKPYPPPTPLNQFRAEFARLRQSVESQE